MCNQDIKNEIRRAGLMLWQVADSLGIADSSFSRKLRKELTDADKERIRQIIREQLNQRGKEAV